VPDEKYGEIPWATVVLRKGAKLGEGDIRAKVAEKLSKVRPRPPFLNFFSMLIPGLMGTTQFKVPARILITDQIPKVIRFLCLALPVSVF
jgi:acyl-CoA synthetase (AMP-forming)/AMP-acid ligase II